MAAAKKVTKAKAKTEKPKKEVAKKTSSKATTKTKSAAKPKLKVVKKADTRPASEILTDLIVHGMQEMKAEDIVVLDLRSIGNASCDFFVIAHGNSTTHCSAISQGVEKEVKKISGEKPWRREGVSNGEWVLIDYVSVVVHVFQKYTRELYNIEDLWADAKTVKIK